MKPYRDTPFAIINNTHWMPAAACEHPRCHIIHEKKGCVEVKRVEWVIIKIATGERAFDGDAYPSRRDAAKVLDWHLAQEKAFGMLRTVLENNEGLAELVKLEPAR